MRPAVLGFSPQASDQPPLCDGQCGVALPRRFQVDWMFLHAEGGPFDPCDKLIHSSICVNFHPMVDIGSFCVSLHVGADPILGRLAQH